jgi:hypothetical protein
MYYNGVKIVQYEHSETVSCFLEGTYEKTHSKTIFWYRSWG